MNIILKTILKNIVFVLVSLAIFACGKTSVTIDESTYEPKIVINGYLYPNQRVNEIRVTRNFSIGQTIDKSEIPLKNAFVTIEEIGTLIKFPLSYNADSAYFEDVDNYLQIDYGKSYRLYVEASIDGKNLSASSTTTIPKQGLRIDRQESIYGDLFYRQTDENNQLITPRVAYRQSEDASFYLLSISARNASISSFIYENPFGFDIQEALDEGAQIENFKYSVRWTRPDNIIDGLSTIEINWFHLWFYGEYSLVLYAGDQNFYHFYNTHRNVQEIDGNLHEPIFDIEGDGIGVFGSAVVDTIYLNVLKK